MINSMIMIIGNYRKVSVGRLLDNNVVEGDGNGQTNLYDGEDDYRSGDGEILLVSYSC